MYKSNLLEQLYLQYNLSNLKHGKLGDKLGDCFEEFVVIILKEKDFLNAYNSNQTIDCIEYDIFYRILNCFDIHNYPRIYSIEATSKIQSRFSGGLPKTDVIADLQFEDGSTLSLPISVKQSTVKKVAFAEFDVNTILNEVGIEDAELIRLLLKHQNDASAKNFTPQEKIYLNEILSPHSQRFVQWVITGCPEECDDLRIPKCIVKFDLKKVTHDISNYKVFSIADYVDSIMRDNKGNIRSGGFGTGLSWTYATGSKGKKIQFKG